MSRARYVYAIMAGDAGLAPHLTGFCGRPVEPVRYRDLVAATSEIEPAELEPVVEAAVVHEGVVETLQQSGALLPVRFGTVLADADAVIAELSQKYGALLADLERIGNKVEFGLTVLWKLPEDTEEAVEVKEFDGLKATNADGPGTRYLRARLTEQLRDSAVRGRAAALWDTLDAAFVPHYLDSRHTILPTPRIAVRAAHLLQPEATQAYQETFEYTRRTHPELRFLLSGPWPPYSFVSTLDPNQKAVPGDEAGTHRDQQEEVAHGQGCD